MLIPCIIIRGYVLIGDFEIHSPFFLIPRDTRGVVQCDRFINMLIYASAPPVPLPVPASRFPLPSSRFPFPVPSSYARPSAYSPTTEFLLYSSSIHLVSFNRTISVRSDRFSLRKYFISYRHRLTIVTSILLHRNW